MHIDPILHKETLAAKLLVEAEPSKINLEKWISLSEKVRQFIALL